MKLTPHEEKILALVKQHPEIVDDHQARERIARENGISEKTLRNRIGDLKKYGVVDNCRMPIGGPVAIPDNYKIYYELWKSKYLIILNTFLIGLLSIIVSLLLPKWYTSSAIIISSEVQQSNFLSMLSGLPVGNFGLSNVSEDINKYISIIKSRQLQEEIVAQYDLISRYDSRDLEYAIMDFNENLEVKVTEEGMLKVSVTDKKPDIARDIVVSILEILDRINIKINSEKNAYSREFLEDRLMINRKELADAEQALVRFQNKHGVVDIPAQVDATLTIYAELYAQIVTAEIEYTLASVNYSEQSPKVVQLERLINDLHKQLDGLTEPRSDQAIFLTFKDLPELSAEYGELIRNVKIQNKILEILIPQYEQHKMEEKKDVPTLQIIDEPKVPINKSKPKRAIIVVASTIMAIISSIGFVILRYTTSEFIAFIKNN